MKILQKHCELLLIIFDIIALVCSYFIACLLRFDFQLSFCIEVFRNILIFMPVIILINFCFFVLFKVNRGIWKYVSTKDALNIIYSVFLSSLFIFLLKPLFIMGLIPRSIYIIAPLLQTTIMLIFRVSYRYLRMRLINKDTNKQCLIIGTGDAGELLLREINSNKNYLAEVAGFIDEILMN